MVPLEAPIAHVEGVFNAVVAEGDFVGTTVYEGRGAGAGPTASAVAADLIDIARELHAPAFGVPVANFESIPAAPMKDRVGPYYVRLMVVDRPGIFAEVAAVLRDHQVSMESVLQRGRAPGDPVPVVMTTHDTREASMAVALELIGRLEAVVEPPRMIRIEPLHGAEQGRCSTPRKTRRIRAVRNPARKSWQRTPTTLLRRS